MSLDIEVGQTIHPGLQSILLRVRNASRRYLIVSFDPPAANLSLWPVQIMAGIGFGAPEGTNCIQLYRATLADLITGDWYLYCDAPGMVYWIDAWDA